MRKLIFTILLLAIPVVAQHRITLTRQSAEAVYKTGDNSLLVEGHEVDVWTRSERPTAEELHLALRLALGIVPRCLDTHSEGRDGQERWVQRPPMPCKKVSDDLPKVVEMRSAVLDIATVLKSEWGEHDCAKVSDVGSCNAWLEVFDILIANYGALHPQAASTFGLYERPPFGAREAVQRAAIGYASFALQRAREQLLPKLSKSAQEKIEPILTDIDFTIRN